ncbi:hypothetical protein [Actinacidiphila rubida]|uniref:Uncharacterized protein n=1 Tax=Actinacidiphila rubida TaxID=310780 RepID=A0A1H8JLE4_9ACTN|nr:hypothetical protein [Actinacidiphila rubida]SEN81146.1 hypothetical protein SAMN05216267_1010169 [Actinacidiphila rubida]
MREAPRGTGGTGQDRTAPGGPEPEAVPDAGRPVGATPTAQVPDVRDHGGPRGVDPGDVDLDRVWLGVAAQVWERRPGPVERAAARLLRSPGLARVLLTTPSLLLPWLAATVVVLAAGAVATAGTGQPVVALAAPGLAGAAVAYSYGPGLDSAWELSRTMAVSDRMVLLARVLTVFAVNALLASAASAVSPAAAGIAFGWLVPMAAVSALALAVATVTESANAGVGAALAVWTLTVVASQSATRETAAAVTRSALVLPYLAVAACCAAVVLHSTRTTKGSR